MHMYITRGILWDLNAYINLRKDVRNLSLFHLYYEA